MNFFFVVLHLFVGKLIHNRCACYLIIKTISAQVSVNEQLHLCFYVLVRNSLLSSGNGAALDLYQNNCSPQAQ